MFPLPTSFSDFLGQSLKTLPYLAVILGLLFFSTGAWQVNSSSSFSEVADKVEALVIKIDEKEGENSIVYRPTFEIAVAGGNPVRYSGNTWISPKPHDVGDVVSAGFDPETGVILSDAMLAQTQYMGRIFMTVGAATFVLGAGFFAWRRFSGRART
ncbi:hypothetical protein [Paracoccus onubensis]|uniref:hypothetical protein n=1 Tax=Paracoccus onubensis TaxID=1675788 RepID=UPI0011C3F4A3|nr:hypothetical protein [Paracoccus onubensis]